MKKFLYILFFWMAFVNVAFLSNIETGEKKTDSSGLNNFAVSDDEFKCTDCHSDLVEPKYLHAAIEDCETCHAADGEDHPSTSGFSLSEKVPALCSFCHDEIGNKDHVHYPAGEGECMTCHNVHSSDYKALLIDNPEAKLCYECHDSKNPENKIVHSPISEGNCSGCHDPHESKNASLLKSKGTKLCFSCHKDLKEKADTENLHYPFDEDCSNCHNAHNSNEKKLLNDKIPGLCNTCHDVKNTKKHVHYPIEEGECMTCHSPHSSSAKALLTAETGEVCAQCHDINESKKIMHQPVKEGKCASCHDPHQSENSTLLKKKSPELCFNCHKNTQKESKLANIHMPFGDDCSVCHSTHGSDESNLLNDSKTQLCFNCHEKFDKKANIHGPVKEGKCTDCHSPHASSENKILRKNEQAMCLACHNKVITLKDKKISNVAQKLKKGNFVHAPIETDGCSACHDPHSSDNQSLLTEFLDTNIYTKVVEKNFELCFKCHDWQLVEKEKGPLITEFRTGDRNMHYIHINRDKGRNCALCHDVHGSKNKHLIAEKVWFGKWKMPLNYIPYANGGSCATGCHSKKTYIKD